MVSYWFQEVLPSLSPSCISLPHSSLHCPWFPSDGHILLFLNILSDNATEYGLPTISKYHYYQVLKKYIHLVVRHPSSKNKLVINKPHSVISNKIIEGDESETFFFKVIGNDKTPCLAREGNACTLYRKQVLENIITMTEKLDRYLSIRLLLWQA